MKPARWLKETRSSLWGLLNFFLCSALALTCQMNFHFYWLSVCPSLSLPHSTSVCLSDCLSVRLFVCSSLLWSLHRHVLFPLHVATSPQQHLPSASSLLLPLPFSPISLSASHHHYPLLASDFCHQLCKFLSITLANSQAKLIDSYCMPRPLPMVARPWIRQWH